MLHIVRETFNQAGFDEPTRRHYSVQARTSQEAVKAIREMRFCFHGIIYGSVPGSQIEVVASR
jgi:hypothetical protein